MKILGVGLSRTGTLSLHRALQMLGYKSIHWELQILRDVIDGSNKNPNFRRYDHVDAVTDIPAAYFYRELFEIYPDCLFILTTRDAEDWYRSIQWHYDQAVPMNMAGDEAKLEETRQLQKLVYGSDTLIEDLYKIRFAEHNNSVIQSIPPHQLLIMDVTAGEGWEKLCPFLNHPVPKNPFPFFNRRFNDGV